MKSIRVSGSFDLFPQPCVTPTLSPEQHAHEVNKELKDAAGKLNKGARKKLLKAMAKHLKDAENKLAKPTQRVADGPSSEGEYLT